MNIVVGEGVAKNVISGGYIFSRGFLIFFSKLVGLWTLLKNEEKNAVLECNVI